MPVAIPVARNEVYFYWAQSPKRLVLVGDGPPRVVFDLDEVSCASGLGCPGGPGYVDYRFDLKVIGADDKHGRLWVSVSEHNNGNGRGWLLGVHAKAKPVTLATPNQAWGAVGSQFAANFGNCSEPNIHGMGFPDWAVATGGGEVLTNFGRRDPYFGRLPSDIAFFYDRVRRVWGDTLIQSTVAGLFEVVEVPERVEPGELLVYSYENSTSGSEHGKLLHVPARGGTGEVFRLPKVQVMGMDAAPDGRVCLAAPVPGVFLQVKAHPHSFGMPSLLLTEIRVGNVVDCAYGPDGRPHLLMTDPPRVLVWNGADDVKNPRSADPGNPKTDSLADFELRPLPESSKPLQLLVDPDGSDRVLDLDGDVPRQRQPPHDKCDVVQNRSNRDGLSLEVKMPSGVDSLDVQERPHEATEPQVRAAGLLQGLALSRAERVEGHQGEIPANDGERVVQVVDEVTHPEAVLCEQVRAGSRIGALGPAQCGTYLPFEQPGHDGLAEEAVDPRGQQGVATVSIMTRTQRDQGDILETGECPQLLAASHAARPARRQVEDDDIGALAVCHPARGVDVRGFRDLDAVAFEENAKQEAVVGFVFY